MDVHPPNTDMSVDLIGGSFNYHTVDLVIPAKGFDFRIERWHRSDAVFNSLFQIGWQFDWDERLEFDTFDESIRYWAPGFLMSRFVKDMEGNHAPAVPWIYSSLESQPNGEYRIRLKNGQERFFGGDGRLLRRVDRHGNTQTFTWRHVGDEAHLEIRDPAGRKLHVSNVTLFEGGGLVTTVTDWTGRTLQYERADFGGLITKYTDPEGNVTTYTYHTTEGVDPPAFLGIESIIHPNGLWVTNHALGAPPESKIVKRQVFSNGLVVDYDYDLDARRTTVNRGGRVSLYEWDEDGNIVRVTDPAGNVWTYEYDGQRLVTQVTDPNLATIRYTHDARGNVLTRENQKGHVWTYEYEEEFDQVTRIVGPAPFAYETSLTYDPENGDLLEQVDPLGRATTFEHEPDGLLKKVIPPGPNPNVQELFHDELGQLVEVRNGLGEVTTFEHDAVGNRVAVTDPLGLTTRLGYDRLNRPVWVETPLGHRTRFRFDGSGNVMTVTDPLNRSTRFDYGPLNQLLQVQDPAGGRLSYGRDLFGNVVRQTDPNGNSYTFAFDELDRQVETVDPLGQVTRELDQPYCGTILTTDAEERTSLRFRDVTCLETGRAYADGLAYSFEFDEEQRRTVMAESRGALKYGQMVYGASPYADRIKYGQPVYGSIPYAACQAEFEETTYTWDGNNRLTQVKSPGDKTLDFLWDEAGRLARITDIHGIATDYGYNAADRLVTVTREGKVTSYEHDAAGRTTKLSYPNGVTCNFSYDDDSRVTRMLWKSGPVELYDIGYRYAPDGNRTRRSIKTLGRTTIEDYAYDALSRLTRVDENGTVRAQYRFDPAGNRLLKKGPAVAKLPQGTYGIMEAEEWSNHDAADELVSTNQVRFRWDRVGRLVEKDAPVEPAPTRYEWNGAHRLSRVVLPDGGTASYRYNGDGLRTWRQEPSGQATRYCWVPEDVLGLAQVMNELDGTGARKADYVLGPWNPVGLIQFNGHAHYYITDALGSVLALVDQDGDVCLTYHYDGFGIPGLMDKTIYNPFRFTGQCWDASTNLYYLRHRYYSPEQGAFLRRDPAGLAARYCYSANNPINLIDPDGRKEVSFATSDQTVQYSVVPGINMTDHIGFAGRCTCPEISGMKFLAARGGNVYGGPALVTSGTREVLDAVLRGQSFNAAPGAFTCFCICIYCDESTGMVVWNSGTACTPYGAWRGETPQNWKEYEHPCPDLGANCAERF